jgi:F-type H+-transporting ATPase subunit gamma
MEGETKGRDYMVLPIGKKSVEYFRQRGVELFTEEYSEVAKISVSDCFGVAKMICDAYSKGKFGHVLLCYTDFVSMMTQTPKSSSLLPLSDFTLEEEGQDEPQKPERDLILYEPDSESVFNAIVPEYLAGLLYTSINVSVASELAARRTAMEAATDNAGEMIEKLSLFYNRARQASITQELTEIVAGAEGN